jgi:hypothetical protein
MNEKCSPTFCAQALMPESRLAQASVLLQVSIT